MRDKNIKKPNVLIAGFPRCGSTWLYYLLKQHPDIYIPDIKEINYFNKDHFFLAYPEVLNPRYFRPRKWYYNFFKTDKKVVIDFSIISALDIGSARRVKEELGDIKIIFLTRNKEDFISSTKKMMDKWREKYDKIERYSDFQYYEKFYKENFSKIYETSVEKINKNPERELNNILRFMGLKEHKFNFNVLKHESKTERKISMLPYLKRKIYIGLMNSIYFIISLTARAKAIPD